MHPCDTITGVNTASSLRALRTMLRPHYSVRDIRVRRVTADSRVFSGKIVDGDVTGEWEAELVRPWAPRNVRVCMVCASNVSRAQTKRVTERVTEMFQTWLKEAAR